MINVLFVDDEISILNSIERLFMSHGREILRANSAEEALELFEQYEIGVLVTDQRMPGMKGTELVNRVKQVSPDTVRLVLSGYTELTDLLEAINAGEIFRFLVKPWDDDALLENVNQALERYERIRKLQRSEEATLLSLAQTIELKDPYTRGHCDRVARYAEGIARKLGLPEQTIGEIKHGSWLHDCGKIGIPDDVINKPKNLDRYEMAQMQAHPLHGADVARQAQLSETIVQIILCHHEKVDGTGYPQGLKGDAIPLEARIVSVADVYDAISSDRPYRKACDDVSVERIMNDSRGTLLDAELVDLFMVEVLPEIDSATNS